jgi:ankyrin repeat protein
MNSTLLCAVKAGNTTGASALLSNGADVYQKNSMGDTAMHLAVTRPGNSLVLEMLLGLGATQWETDTEGRTALYFAKKDQVHRGTFIVEIPLQNLQHG